MITLHCYPGYEDSYTVMEHLVYGIGIACPSPLAVLPLLVEEDLLHTPACEEVLRQLSDGLLHLDADPCYLAYRDGYRRPLSWFSASMQAALAVAAVASLPPDQELLHRLLRQLPNGALMSGIPGNFFLEMTPELCDAKVWRALNNLDLPVDLVADLQTLQTLRRKLDCTPPEDGREKPYRLMQSGAIHPWIVLTHQDTTGWDSDPQITHRDGLGWSGDVLLTGGDGFDLITFSWQDPHSWYRWDLAPALYKLPVPRTDPQLPDLPEKYIIHDRMTRQDCLDNLQNGQTLYLMVLDRDAEGNWRTDEQLLENCCDYRELFEEALRGAELPQRWVLAADLDRPPLCLQELTRCSVVFGFRLHADTVTLTNGTDALYTFLKALESYNQACQSTPEQDREAKEEPHHV